MTQAHDPSVCGVCASPGERPIRMRVRGYAITRCGHCGVGRTLVDQFRPQDIYHEGYFSGETADGYADYVGNAPTILAEFRGLVDRLRRWGPAQGSLFEVGCAYGYFLREAAAHFRVAGVEMASAAARACVDAGFENVRAGPLDARVADELTRAAGPFDVAVMLDVIEHIDNVDETVALLSQMVRPDGLLVITTGDWASLASRILGPRWRLIAPPFHLWYFTPRSLDILMRRHGFERIALQYPVKRVPLDLVIKQAASMAGFRSTSVLKWAKGLSVPATLFDTMRAAFRRLPNA